MNVILLCAGYATRLYPLTENQPKALLPVAGRPILEYLVEKLEGIEGIQQIFVVSNSRFYPPFKTWAAAKRYPWPIEVLDDGTQTNETRLGAIGDLRFVIQKFGLQDDLIVFAGDNLFASDLNGFISFARSHRPHASIGVSDVKDRNRARLYGIVQIDADHRIVEFLEKPESPPTTLASTGVYWFSRERTELLDRYFREGHNADRPGDYIRWLVARDRVFAYPFEGGWFDIGDVDSYQEANRFFAKVRGKTKQKK